VLVVLFSLLLTLYLVIPNTLLLKKQNGPEKISGP
jgi:hypothetical protein